MADYSADAVGATPRIASVASAFPKHYYPQEFLTNELKRLWGDRVENPKLLDRLHAHAGVEGRYLALPAESYEHLATWGQANRAWIECAQEIGHQAICSALTRAGMGAQELDALFV